jgi:DNA-binding transcriptional regulator/RsmH inhibitor MraZ
MPYIGNIVQDFSVNTAMLNTDSVTSIKIDDGTIVNADINDSAAIAGTKIDPSFKSTGDNIDEISLTHSGNTVKIASLGQISSHGSLALRKNNGSLTVRLSATTESSYINSGGNVGIGTSSPSTPLHVSTNTDGTSDLLTLHADADGTNNGIASIKFTGNTGNHAAFIKGGHTTNGDSILTFHTDAHDSGINPEERMRIDTSGNVGIGTTSIDSALHVYKQTNDRTARFQRISSQHIDITQTSGINSFTSTGKNFEIGTTDSQSFIFDTNGSERMRIDSDGRLLIGSTSALSHGGIESHLQVLGTGTDDSSITLSRFSNNVHSPYIAFAKSRNGSVGGNTVVQSGDSIGRMTFFGNDGTDGNTPAAEIDVEVDGTPGSNDMPGRIVFRTTSDGASSVTERMRVDSSGDITVNFDGSSQTGQFKIADGSASSPGLTFWADGSNDTGIFRSGANTLNFSTAGSERMRIDSSGNVGINQAPTRELSLHSPNNNNALIHFTNDDTGETSADGILVGLDGNENMVINNQETGKTINFYNGGSERMRIDSSGRVMIGNDQASTQYQDGGDDLVIGNTSGSHGITVISQNNNVGRLMFSDTYSAGTGTYEGQILYSHALNTMNFYANYTANQNIAMTIGGSNGDVTVHGGNVIIGTSGKGIDFSATANASGMSNELLDDYEEGTFTPVLNNAGSFSVNNHTGTYTKVGRLVHYIVQISGTCTGTGSGIFTVSGLPFSANNATGGHGQAGCMGALFRWNIPDTAYQIGIRVSDSNSFIQFFANFDNANDAQLTSPFDAGTIFGSLAGSYFTS